MAPNVIDRVSMLVASFLDAARPGTRALLIHGEAGIGKTTAWRSALHAATQRGYRVMSAQPSAAEQHLPFAGLSDLLSGLAAEHGGGLPAPQRAALDVALMRADPEATPTQPLALSLAVLGLLRRAAASTPIAVGVDDCQWLDAPSAAALRFALRRLEEGQVVVVAAERTTDPAPSPALLADLETERVVNLPLEPLGRDGVDRLLDSALGLAVAPSVVARVHRQSNGNPMHVLEIGRAMLAAGGESALDGLVLPDSLAGLVRQRIAALPPDACAVVVHAAALAHPTPAQLERALGPDRAARGIAAARAADVVLATGGPLRFTHPLLGGEAYTGLSEEERRRVHGRLAEVVTEPEEHARHLALAASEPDAGVAMALDAAAERARSRGAPDSAADLCELAARLTPVTTRAWSHRIAESARHRVVAGDFGRARAFLERAVAEPGLPEDEGRAEMLYRLATVRQLMDDFAAARELGTRALDLLEGDVALSVEVRLLLAGVAFITGVDWADGLARVREAMALAEQSDEPRLLAMVIGKEAQWRYMTGGGFDAATADRADALEAWTSGFRALDMPAFDLSLIRLSEGMTAEAQAGLHALAERAEREGDYSSLPFLLASEAIGAFLDGRATESRGLLRRAIRLARTTEQRVALAHTLVAEVRVEARLGNRERAREAADEAFALMEATQWRAAEYALRADLAVLELSHGDAPAALAVAQDEVSLPRPDESPRRMWAVPTLAQVFVALGRHDDARRALDELDTDVAARSRSLRADAMRARAQVLAATGDLEGAEAAIAATESEHREMANRWELARTLLAAGEIHRRSRHRARARAAFREALTLFSVLGAGSWARVAREQMGRSGTGRREGGLTPAQRGVAELVATGLTNRQVGDRLSMSVHTVEAHLSEVYRSLGIRSRRQLAPLLGTGAIRDATPPIRDTATS